MHLAGQQLSKSSECPFDTDKWIVVFQFMCARYMLQSWSRQKFTVPSSLTKYPLVSSGGDEPSPDDDLII